MSKLCSFCIAIALNISCVGILLDSSPVNAQTLYNITYNKHGRVLNTSEGTFYVGRSGDAIRSVSGKKIYGYWKESNGLLSIYIGDRIYNFNLGGSSNSERRRSIPPECLQYPNSFYCRNIER
ncbi:hypothetical protein [Cyanobacterium sp. Dongsha4]|uniref:hypothetical protein n=1 Tax=Cyanobacterium sp. DS4 TaxID=2878255 RepID=UPI002E81BC97|nr:hypothetical protein [Cyanobacterium sp. Dongsha4]WVL00216.1 hypothetical protein Dongsha4_16420 [Cyanobacterium sp. Dongsha4]